MWNSEVVMSMGMMRVVVKGVNEEGGGEWW